MVFNKCGRTFKKNIIYRTKSIEIIHTLASVLMCLEMLNRAYLILLHGVPRWVVRGIHCRVLSTYVSFMQQGRTDGGAYGYREVIRIATETTNEDT